MIGYSRNLIMVAPSDESAPARQFISRRKAEAWAKEQAEKEGKPYVVAITTARIYIPKKGKLDLQPMLGD